MDKLKRAVEVKVLRKKINELLGLIGFSKSKWKSLHINRVKGSGHKYVIDSNYGHKPSMRQQYSLLYDLFQEKLKNEEIIKEMKENLEKEMKNANEKA